MCTGFACYHDRPLYAMNFDCWEVPLRMRLSSESIGPVLWFEADMGGGYLETAAMNWQGFFGNFQGNLSTRHQNVEPGPATISIAEVYRQSLKTADRIADLQTVIGNRTLVYPPVPPEWNMLHNLFADKHGQALVLETANARNEITAISQRYLVMTNFPVNEFRGLAWDSVYGAGDDRYKVACEYLEQASRVGIAEAFGLLMKTAQNTEGWKTLCSMVFDPLGLQVHFVIDQNFTDVFTIDIQDRTVTCTADRYPGELKLSFEGFAGLKRVNM